MKTYKIEDLEGALLDAAVAKAAGVDITYHDPASQAWGIYPGVGLIRWRPSTSWELGGAIIERENITTFRAGGEGWAAFIQGPNCHYVDTDAFDEICGPTPLIAAMRAFVASKFGQTVEL